MIDILMYIHLVRHEVGDDVGQEHGGHVSQRGGHADGEAGVGAGHLVVGDVEADRKRQVVEDDGHSDQGDPGGQGLELEDEETGDGGSEQGWGFGRILLYLNFTPLHYM